LRFDRIESDRVDLFTGDPRLRRAEDAEPAPHPTEHIRQAERLIAVSPEILRNNGFD
jgi:hypothetical protein